MGDDKIMINKKTNKMYISSVVFISCCIFGIIYFAIGIYPNLEYISGDNPENPLSYSNIPITNSIKMLTDSCVDKSDNEHTKTIKIMKYVDNNIDCKRPTYNPNQIATPNIILKNKQGIRGEFAMLSVAMIASHHIPTHIISMCGKDGHVGMEVYYNNSWHYYDPTFSAYFEKNGTVLSFEDLKAGGARYGTLIIGNTTRSSLYPTYPPFYLSPEIFETYYPSGASTKECPLIANCKPCQK